MSLADNNSGFRSMPLPGWQGMCSQAICFQRTVLQYGCGRAGSIGAQALGVIRVVLGGWVGAEHWLVGCVVWTVMGQTAFCRVVACAVSEIKCYRCFTSDLGSGIIRLYNYSFLSMLFVHYSQTPM